MSRKRISEAERLAQHRIEFQRAMADGTSIAEARKALAWDRWRATQALLETKHGVAPPPRDAETQPEQWWQRL